jgi:hypothetical protein
LDIFASSHYRLRLFIALVEVAGISPERNHRCIRSECRGIRLYEVSLSVVSLCLNYTEVLLLQPLGLEDYPLVSAARRPGLAEVS